MYQRIAVLKLYLVSQSINSGYATHDSIVVAAYTAGAAKKIDPSGLIYGKGSTQWGEHTWAEKPSQCTAEHIGTASPKMKNNSVVLASFHAG